MSHTCHAIGCDVKTPREMFMCRRHWYMVPRALRTRIWKYYRPGQCDDMNPSRAYCDAAKAAVLAVAGAERRTVDPKDTKLALYDWLGQHAT